MKATRKEVEQLRGEYDFSKAKRAKDIPHLAKLQQEAKGPAGAFLND